MAEVNLSDITKSFGAVHVIKGVDLDIETGEFVVFVGPSGCGKSTLLRLIAGLEDITSGTMKIDGEVVNDVPPSKRGIAMVFQSYALYPHMTVYNNMAFGMKLARASKEEIDKRGARSAADILQLDAPISTACRRQLSGGQRQRVAIGRAIVRKPKVFLFDEPLSNLDAALRVADAHRDRQAARGHVGTTMIYVTHDQVEAMTLADRIVVLNAGQDRAGRRADGALSPAGEPLRRRASSARPAMNLIADARRRSRRRRCARRAAGRRRGRRALRRRARRSSGEAGGPRRAAGGPQRRQRGDGQIPRQGASRRKARRGDDALRRCAGCASRSWCARDAG